jgi:integrase
MKSKFRLFKRPGRDAYYFVFTFRGERYLRCTECTDATDAQKIAKAKYAAITKSVITGETAALDPTKLRQTVTGTIGELIAAYKDSPSDANTKTRKRNANELKRLVPESGTISQLTASLARNFFADVNKSALAESDQVAAASMRRTANSSWRRIKSMFTPKCEEHYKTRGLYHPVMAEFVKAGEAAKFTGRTVPKIAYNPPPDEIVQKTLVEWEALAEVDRNLYLAIGHELAFGLRAGEVSQVAWGWHQVRNGFHVLESHAAVKSGTGWLQVKALDPFFTQMQIQIDLRGWRGEPDDLVITGSTTYRTDNLFRGVTAWLRRLGWETQKSNHALRAYAGGQVAMKYGIYDAQQFLRHSSVQVTEQNYGYFINKFKVNPEQMPVKWAFQNKVASKILDATLDATRDVGQGGLGLAKVEGVPASARN